MTNKRTDPIYQAQDILSRRDHSEFEVRTKLKNKRFSPQDIDTAIAWLYKHKLLNDKTFAERYISSTLLIKPVGPRWLSAKLKQKGVSTTIIEETLEHILPPQKERRLAADAARRWQKSRPANAGDRQKLFKFLQGRGFSFEAIGSATNSEAA